MVSAPRSFGSALQLNKIPVLGFVPESGSSAPSSPVQGQLWLDTSISPARLKVYENGAFGLVSAISSELLVNKNATNGYAGLTSGLIAIGQIPTGQTGTTVPFGNDSRFTDTRTPSANSITTGMIIDGAITDADVNAANKDGVVGTASLRTIGTGALQAMAGNTTLATIAAPAGSVSLNTQKITNLLDPTSAQDAATKAYVDSLAAGLDPKASVRLASTANVSVTYNATNGTSTRGQITVAPNTLDSVTLVAGDRILLKDQSTGAQNGIYVVSTVGTGANGIWDRATDFDTDAEVTAGAFTFVEAGTINSDSGWVLTTNNPIVIGGGSGTALAWAQFSGAGSITAGNGLTKTGSSIDAVGTSGRIVVGADNIDIDSAYVGQTSITTLGTIATGTWSGTTIALNKGGTGQTTAVAALAALGGVGKYAADCAALVAGTELIITHSLGTKDVHVQFRRNADDYEEVLSWRAASTTTIGVTADVAYSTSALRVVVMG